ncbi:MAG TPA: MerR family transcriptional regulator [Chryseolinea sp.]|nr:MerR family transcriptional regulator [Chryseolinea sp.]
MTKTFSQITFDFSPPEIAASEAPPVTLEDSHATALKDHSVVVIQPRDQPASVIASKPSGRGRKSQKTFAAEADLVCIPDDEQLFSKQYYSIGEVSQMFKVNASLLRFWESEFDIIKPRKNRKGDRHFRPVDIKNLQLIYDLLRRRKLTIEGAKDFLRNNKKSQERFEMIQSLQKVKAFILEIKASI